MEKSSFREERRDRVLTATANHQSDTAVISVLGGQKLAPATVRWSLQPMPGLETLLVVQAVPGDNAPAFYSVEWSKSENSIVRALPASGEQKPTPSIIGDSALRRHQSPN
jgi:hypothetical protein